MQKIWRCEIGPIDEKLLPLGADHPMRVAVQEAFKKMLGIEAEYTFTGWEPENTLSDTQKEIITEDRARAGRTGIN